MTGKTSRVGRLILTPAIITLAVTLVRLSGERMGWNEFLFNRSAGGGGSILGITWLALVFAVYFAVKLQNAGEVFQSSGGAVGRGVLALGALIGGITLMFWKQDFRFSPLQLSGIAVSVFSLLLMRWAWPAYWNLMTAYALAARIPVLVVMFLAFRGNWGTHYDALPPQTTFDTPGARFVHLGVIPQLFFWVPFNVVFCGLIGICVTAVRKWRAAESG
jgi:hypothetical protein